jgi:hypothetical protein
MSVWTERTAKRTYSCDRCGDFIEAGDSYLDRFGEGHTKHCVSCYKAITKAGEDKRAVLAKPYHRQKVRKAGDPLLGVGHIVQGLGVLRP